MYYDAACPYCEVGQEINHDDGYGYQEDETYEQECGNCGKTFAYTTSLSYHHETMQADCLNGGEHQWKKWRIFPQLWPDAKRCTACGEEVRGKIDKELYEKHSRAGTGE